MEPNKVFNCLKGGASKTLFVQYLSLTAVDTKILKTQYYGAIGRMWASSCLNVSIVSNIKQSHFWTLLKFECY